jgi:hypothetical protein
LKTNRESDAVHEPAATDDDALRQRFPKPTLPAAIHQGLTIVGMNAYLLYLVVEQQSSPVAIALFAVLELISMSLITNLALIGVPQPLRVGSSAMPIPKRIFAIAFVSAGLLGIAWFGVSNDRERIIDLIRQRDPIGALRELHILWPLLTSAALAASVSLGDRLRWSRTGGSFVNGTAMQAAPKFITAVIAPVVAPLLSDHAYMMDSTRGAIVWCIVYLAIKSALELLFLAGHFFGMLDAGPRGGKRRK